MFKPKLFGRYYLIDLIAQGGMAIIYLAKSVSIDGFEKPLVIKTIHPDLAQDPAFVKRFTNEAKTVVHLTHGNIVPVFDMGVQNGEYYIAMEYIAGKNLKQMLLRCAEKGIEISPEMAIFITIEICKGLAYAHRKVDRNNNHLNIVHRDVSPQNVLISYEGEVKIVDFGIAQAADRSGSEHTGLLEGKLRYMAPEQVACEHIDRRTDVYATGCVLFEILTGRKLFNQEDFQDLYASVMTPDIAGEVLGSRFVPSALKPVLIKALAANKEDRYREMESLQMALTHILYSSRSMINSADLAGFMCFLFKREIVEEQEMLRKAQVVGMLLKETGDDIQWEPSLFNEMELRELEDAFGMKAVSDGRATFPLAQNGLGDKDPSSNLLEYIRYGRVIPRGTIIFEEGDPGNHLFIIEKGTVRIYKTIKESETTLAVLREGDFFGEMSLLNTAPRSATAEAMEDVQLIAVPRDSFRNMVKSNIDIVIKIMQRLASRLRDTDDLIENMMLGDDFSRLLHGLMKMAAYKDPLSGRYTPVRLSLVQLMELTGMQNRKTGMKHLKNLVDEGILQLQDELLVVKDPDRLEKFFLSLIKKGSKAKAGNAVNAVT